MTIEEIADRLNHCANATGCDKCPYKNYVLCMNELIKAMGEECRKIAEGGVE